jgi:hypothetical protein
MFRASIWILVAALVGGCGDGSKPSESGPSTPTASLEPFTGKLTSERILGSKNLVKPLDSWDRAEKKLVAKLGKPTRINENMYEWAVAEGDSCTYVQIEKQAGEGSEGATVGMVMTPEKYEKDGPIMNYRECLAITGVTAGPKEDPNAEGPPTDGKPVPMETFMDLAVKGRSKWKGQRVKVQAAFSNITTSSMKSGDTTVTSSSASLVISKDKTQPVLACALRKGQEPASEQQYTPVIAEGTVRIDEWTKGSGEASLVAALEDCTLTFASVMEPAPKGSASAAPKAP